MRPCDRGWPMPSSRPGLLDHHADAFARLPIPAPNDPKEPASGVRPGMQGESATDDPDHASSQLGQARACPSLTIRVPQPFGTDRIRLDDPSVSTGHAYLQVIEGCPSHQPGSQTRRGLGRWDAGQGRGPARPSCKSDRIFDVRVDPGRDRRVVLLELNNPDHFDPRPRSSRLRQ